MEALIYCYSEENPSPRAREVLRAVAEQALPEFSSVKFADYVGAPPGAPILVFGNKQPPGSANVPLVYTYSIAQIMAKANAATVLSEAMRNYVGVGYKNGLDEQVLESYWFQNAHIALSGFNFDFSSPIAIDIETSGRLGETHTPEEVELVSIAFCQNGKSIWVGPLAGHLTFTPAQIQSLRQAMAPIQKPVYHNGKFDTRVLNRVLDMECPVWFDTMLAHHVLNHAAGEHGLEALAKRYFGASWKDNVAPYTKNGYEHIPHELLSEYNMRDTYWTEQLFKLFSKMIESDENMEKAFLLEMSAAEFLLKVEQRGIPMNENYLTDLGDSAEGNIYLVKLMLANLTGNPDFNPNSPQQVKAYLSSQGYDLKKTDVEALTALMESDPPREVGLFVGNMLSFRKESKILGTYVKGWRKHMRNGRVHPTFLVHGTSTGRLSSRAPNAQNVPREKRIRGIVGV